MQLIRYHGWPAALADADEVHFHPALLELAELYEDHPLVRFVRAGATRLRGRHRARGGAFDPGRAERFARTLLMSGEEFLALVEGSDAALGLPASVPYKTSTLKLLATPGSDAVLGPALVMADPARLRPPPARRQWLDHQPGDAADLLPV
jgi:hypothetical protein